MNGSVVDRAVCALALAGAGEIARAGIGYDNLTTNTSPATLGGDKLEYADDTTLDPSFGLTIASVSMLARNPFTQGDYSGNLRVRIYRAGTFEPGQELGSAQVPVFLAEGTTQTITVLFSGLTVPGVEIWTSFQFLNPSSPLPALVSGGQPSVGSSTERTAFRVDGTGAWSQSTNVLNPFAIRIETVPAPAGLGAVAAGFLVIRPWRRRR